MKNIVNYITEKFKINSKTIKSNNKELEIKFDKEKVDFPEDDLEQIINYSKDLPITPDKLEYFPNSNAIRFSYYNKSEAKIDYGIILTYINTGNTKGYRSSFLDHYNYINEYPQFPKVTDLKDCFDYIDKKFNEIIK